MGGLGDWAGVLAARNRFDDVVTIMMVRTTIVLVMLVRKR